MERINNTVENIHNKFCKIDKREFEWNNIQLTKHFIERFNERYTDKFDKEDIEKILKEESRKWEYITTDKSGTEFWHKDRKQCYLYDSKNKRLTTTYYLDYQGFEDDFGNQMINTMFNKFEELRSEKIKSIESILDDTIKRIQDIERIQNEIDLLNKQKNILIEEVLQDERQVDLEYDEIDKLAYFIVKNRNYKMEELRLKGK